jgi:DNA-binding transcriptional ArsR family regulator
MTRLGDEIGGLALDLAWSLWSELGVDGAVRRHDRQAIDLEPLIIFTAWIGAADRRLRSRSMEWSIENYRLASAIRMRNLARRASAGTRESLGRYAATVKAHTNAPWPAHGDPLTLPPSVPREVPDLRRPSLLQLRLRALVGVSARAEILRLMLAAPDRAQSAGELAEAAAYGKGSIAQALDLLTMAGIVQVQPSGNRLLYRLARPAEMRQALPGIPSGFPDWAPIFRITESLASYARSTPASSDARVAKLRSLLHAIDDDARRLSIANDVPKATGPASIREFEDWAVTFVADQSGKTEATGGASDVTYTVHHLSYGGWIGTKQARGRQAVQLEPAGTASEPGLDEASGPYELAQAMFLDVLDRNGRKPNGARVNGDLPALSRAFADQMLRPVEGGQDATFTTEFLRRWFENRQLRLERGG